MGINRKKRVGKSKFIPHAPLPAGYKSREAAPPAQDRPACALCLKAATAEGYPASGVRCHYSAASQFAKKGDAELERELGGRGARCDWGRKEGATAGGQGGGEAQKEDEGEAADRPSTPSPPLSAARTTSTPPLSVTTTVTATSALVRTPAISVAVEDIVSSPVSFSSPSPSHSPSPPMSRSPSPFPLDLAIPPPLTPYNFSRPSSPCSNPSPAHAPAFLPPVKPAPSLPFLLASPTLAPAPPFRPRSHTWPLASASSATLAPSATDRRSTAFWANGPLSPDEIRQWSGLLYVAQQCEGSLF
ncbi:hypothetical protein JCM10207_003524 [Rhodosporidiobolus poonsookiae]